MKWIMKFLGDDMQVVEVELDPVKPSSPRPGP